MLKALINAGRIIVLEDLAALSQRVPGHPYVVNSPICQEPEFQQYARKVAADERVVMQLPKGFVLHPGQVQNVSDLHIHAYAFMCMV